MESDGQNREAAAPDTSALNYLVAPEQGDYVAIMDLLEASVSELTPSEVMAGLADAGRSLELRRVQERLESLRAWHAVHATTDSSQILRHSDLLARNWRYTPTLAGRQVHRFYRQVLTVTPAMREVPLAGAARILRNLEALIATTDRAALAEATSALFVDHDALDVAVLEAEDSIATLADRFDLDDSDTAELKEMLIDYATKVAVELDRAAREATRLLQTLIPRFDELALAAVGASEAEALIARGAMVPSKGGRSSDWEGLVAWFAPNTGRSERFSMRIVRALPAMHANLRRLLTSGGAATSRGRALALARACHQHPSEAQALALAALGDHPWRKLHGVADDDELQRVPGWAAGPQVEVPELLRQTGRSGARGRVSAARDNTAAKAQVAAERAARQTFHAAALKEVLAAVPGTTLSTGAARVAFAALALAVRQGPVDGRRTAVKDGLACTVFDGIDGASEALRSLMWRAITPGRHVVFHLPGKVIQRSEVALTLNEPGSVRPERLEGAA